MSRFMSLVLILPALAGCVPGQSTPKEPQTAAVSHDERAVLAACAEHIRYVGWDDYDLSLRDIFTDKERRIIQAHRAQISQLAVSTLARQDSVWAAKVASEFGMVEALPQIRRHFFIPQRCYGWEGPDYDKLESYLEDCQYQYSLAYLRAIERLTGKQIHRAITPTREELATLAACAADRDGESYYWALWMQRKLRLR